MHTIIQNLRNQFVGREAAIDYLHQEFCNWQQLCDLQTRPRIVNLWGMTGLGKTSLVRAFVQQMGLGDQYFHLDMGSRNSNHDIQNLDEFLAQSQSQNSRLPLIVHLDEFHRAATRKRGLQTYEDIEGDVSAMWEFLSDGFFIPPSLFRQRKGFEAILAVVEIVLAKGIVHEGFRVVAEHAEPIRNYLRSNEGKMGLHYSTRLGIAERDYDLNADFVNVLPWRELGRWSSASLVKVAGVESLDTLTLAQVADAIRRLLNNLPQLCRVDLRNSLCIITGNLDGAYERSDDVSAETDADTLHQVTRSLNVTRIRQELLKIFRPEQVGRMGVRHYCLPTLSESEYRLVLRRELEGMREWMRVNHELHIEFDSPFETMILGEGMIPAQGARPILHACQEHGHKALSAILELHRKDDSCHTYKVHGPQDDFSDSVMIQGQARTSYRAVLPQRTERHKLSQDQVWRVAVHEAGHALMLWLTTGKMPQRVSVAASADTLGLTLISPESNGVQMSTRSEVRGRILTLLGGALAECMLLGKDEVSTGCSSDLKRATEQLFHYLHSFGWCDSMVSLPALSDLKLEPLPKTTESLYLEMSDMKAGCRDLLERHRDCLVELAQNLQARRVLHAADMDSILRMSHLSGKEVVHA